MFNFIMQTLNRNEGNSGNTSSSEERTRIAASVILLEAAHADYECSEEELDHVIRTLRSDFDLSAEHAEDLLELAHRKRSQAVDLFEFTSHINEEFSRREKIEGRLEKHEDHFARKLTHLLRLTHREMIDAKLKAREQLQ